MRQCNSDTFKFETNLFFVLRAVSPDHCHAKMCEKSKFASRVCCLYHCKVATAFFHWLIRFQPLFISMASLFTIVYQSAYILSNEDTSHVVNKNNDKTTSTCHHLSYFWDSALKFTPAVAQNFVPFHFQSLRLPKHGVIWPLLLLFLGCFTSVLGDLTGNSKARVISCWRVIDNAVHFRTRLIGGYLTSNHLDCMCVVYNETWLFCLESLTGRSSSTFYIEQI